MEIRNVGNRLSNIDNQEVRRLEGKNDQKKTGKQQGSSRVGSDQVSISPEARQALDVQRYTQMVKDMPDVRDNAVMRAQERMQSGFYDDTEVARKAALKMFE